MSSRRQVWRILTVASMIAALSLGAGAGAGAAAPPTANLQYVTTCEVPSGLQGQPIQVARQMIREAGCRGVIVVRNKCASEGEFGLVVAGPRPSGRIPFKHRITLWRGIVGTMCDELPDNDTPAPSIADFDGTYQGRYDLTGQGLSGQNISTSGDLSLIVKGGQITGTAEGTMDPDGRVTSVKIFGRYQCSEGYMQFTRDGKVSGTMTCSQGQNSVTITVNANR